MEIAPAARAAVAAVYEAIRLEWVKRDVATSFRDILEAAPPREYIDTVVRARIDRLHVELGGEFAVSRDLDVALLAEAMALVLKIHREYARQDAIRAELGLEAYEMDNLERARQQVEAAGGRV